MNNLEFFFGAASGQSRAALQKLEEPNVMLSHATRDNDPWDGIERLFVDSGAFSYFAPAPKGKGLSDYPTDDRDYLDWVREVAPTYWATRDYPCEPELLDYHDRTVVTHQQYTTERTIELFDLADDLGDVPGQRLAVLQGWSLQDYLDHLDQLRDHGLITDRLGIGSVCRRNREAEIRRIVLAVRDELPSSVELHAFGVKQHSLQYPDVLDALASADSNAFNRRAQGDAYERGVSHTWRESAFHYLKVKRQLAEFGGRPEGQQMVTDYGRAKS
jgi:hypothetical protein